MQKLLAESSSGSMSAHRGVAGCDSRALGECVERSLVEIDLAQDFTIGGLDLIEGTRDAAAHFSGCGIGRRCRGIDAGCPWLKGSCLDCAVTVVVDDGIAKDTEEPGIGGAAGLQIFDLRDCPDISSLKDVFSGLPISHTPLDENEEALALGGQVGENGRHIYWMHCLGQRIEPEGSADRNKPQVLRLRYASLRMTHLWQQLPTRSGRGARRRLSAQAVAVPRGAA